MAKSLDLQKRQERLAWTFLAPTLAVFMLVGLYPLLQTFWTSLTNARLGSTATPEIVWFKNYVEIFKDKEFWLSVIHTVAFTVASVTLETVFGLVIALIVHSSFRGRGVVRAAMLVPWALPTVVSAKMWNYMFVDTYGVVNDLLVTRLNKVTALVGLGAIVSAEKIAWLAEPGLALASMVAVDVWKTTPFMALLLLAGLQLIPGDVYEASDVDGASRVQRFALITLPLLKPALLVALIFRTLDALRVFDVVWVMTRGEVATETMATYNFRWMMDFQELGYGSAVSATIFVLIALFVFVYLRVLRTEAEQ